LVITPTYNQVLILFTLLKLSSPKMQEKKKIFGFTIRLKIPYTFHAMKLLLTEAEVQRKVRHLARKISADSAGKEVLLVGVLKGAFIFMADLARRMKFPVKMDFVRLASYGSGTVSSGKVRITKDLETSLKGKDVLIVEDIIDTGVTLQYLFRRLKARKPRSLRTVVLLDKASRRKVRFQPDYVGFTIEDLFVVGYGLDCNEEFRNLPGIYVLK
jgi:hypoxanthine phosphoribosyltransferase